MRKFKHLALHFIPVALMAITMNVSTASAKPTRHESRPDRPAITALVSADSRSMRDVVKEMRRVSREAGPMAARSLPDHIAGETVRARSSESVTESSSAASPHYLSYTFDDQSMLSYYSYQDDASSYVSAYEWTPDYDMIGVYGSVGNTFDGTMALSYYTSDNDGGAYKYSGVGVYESTWVDYYSGEPGIYAAVNRYSSSSDTSNNWSYESSEYRYLDWENLTYTGSGSYAPDGTTSSYYGTVLSEVATGTSYGCSTEGYSSTDYSSGYHYISDYYDNCDQMGSPGNYVSTWSHTDYSYDYSTWQYDYLYYGTVHCSDMNNQPLGYDFAYDMATYTVQYTNMETGEVSSTTACAWNPYSY